MINVILIEDSADDVTLILKALNRSDDNPYLEPFEFSFARSFNAGLEIVRNKKIDVALLDLGLPDTREFDGIDRLRNELPHMPVVVLTRQREETSIAIEALKRGAQDYFNKSHLTDGGSLEKVIRHAIERKKIEQEIIAAREEALKASRAKSEFLSSMSHDIRTPLNCIAGVSDLLLHAKLSEEDHNYVKMLSRASENLLTLVNDVLDLSKIEAGQTLPSKIKFDLLETADNVFDIISGRAHAKGLEVIFKIQPDVPRRIVGDPALLNQILVNLLGNAVKFTTSGEVTLSISVSNLQNNAATLRFIVSDTGMGIPADKFSVIFDSFTQLESNDSSAKRLGSGLGLSICKRLVELMNGEIRVRSKINEGSEFEFDLNLEISKETTEAGVIPQLNLAGVKILVTEDNPANYHILRELLGQWNADVYGAHNSHEAIMRVEAFRQEHKKFDIALLDLRMPGVATGGLELTERIRNDVKSVIMMLPTNHRVGDIERLKQAGVDKYYFKPTKPEQLMQLITEILYSPAATSLETNKKAEKPTATKALSLLVADDSEDNRLLIEAYCKGSGINCDMAENGQQAFEKFQKCYFDLVLLDIQMPLMNGYEALSAIRVWEKAQQRRQVPVLALTAYALREEAEKCLSAGFKAHVTKPITKRDLLQVIRKHAT
jgi:signal transduction histidine kinase/DNA-binding LytR/AlgR family response regulator